jgi:beta-glucosidase
MRDREGGPTARQPLYGVTSLGWRFEGGFNGPGEPANQWGFWERAGKVRVVGRGGEFWRRPEQWLDLAASAGCEVFGLTVEWARIEPEPDRPDLSALDRYAAIVDMCHERAMAPVVTLHDLAHPEWLGEEFWLTPGSPERFAGHVARVAAHLRTRVNRWITLRQPNVVALAGWVGGRHPPGRLAAVSDAWAVVDNLLAAHVLAYRAIHEADADAKVAAGVRHSGIYDWERLLVDLLCAPSLGVERRALDAWVKERRRVHDRTTPPSGVVELAGRRVSARLCPFGPPGGTLAAPRPSPRRAVHVAYSSAPGPLLDAVAVGWFPPAAEVAAIPRTGRGAAGGPGRAARAVPGGRLRPWENPPDPEGLVVWCRDQQAFTPDLPLWVEDGFATGPGHALRSDGWDRPSYLRAVVDAVASAAASAPVGAFFYRAVGDGEGGADPTWPEATFGLSGGEDAVGDAEGGWRRPDAASVKAYRSAVEAVRSPS